MILTQVWYVLVIKGIIHDDILQVWVFFSGTRQPKQVRRPAAEFRLGSPEIGTS